MTSLSLTAAAARRALHAVWGLTVARGRNWCTTSEVAADLLIGDHDALIRLDHLEELDLVVLLGSTSRYQRRWRLTQEGLDAIDMPDVPKGWEGTD